MSIMVFSDNKSFVLVALDDVPLRVATISVSTPSKSDTFNLDKGVRCALARYYCGEWHPQGHTIIPKVLGSPDIMHEFYVGSYSAIPAVAQLMYALYRIFRGAPRKHIWHFVEVLSKFILVYRE